VTFSYQDSHPFNQLQSAKLWWWQENEEVAEVWLKRALDNSSLTVEMGISVVLETLEMGKAETALKSISYLAHKFERSKGGDALNNTAPLTLTLYRCG
jgi:hypothetical protein